jgi:hypothetical protein
MRKDIKLNSPWRRAKVKSKSRLQEERIARMEGGTQQVNSGRFWRWKRDNKLWNFLIEARTTEARSYRIDRDEFLQIKKEATQTPPGLLPGMQIDLPGLNLIVFELHIFQEQQLYTAALEAQLEAWKKDQVSQLQEDDES